jgi:hypothetical protein
MIVNDTLQLCTITVLDVQLSGTCVRLRNSGALHPSFALTQTVSYVMTQGELVCVYARTSTIDTSGR